MYWLNENRQAKITNLTKYPHNISWSRDGKQLAFLMAVEEVSKSFISMPAKPKGAKWSKPARVIDKVIYRVDGQGYVENEFDQIFILPAIGGTARQITSGPYYCYGKPSWSKDGKTLYFYSDRTDDWDRGRYGDTEIFEVFLECSKIKALTNRTGPDWEPVVSPDGSQIAYLGFDDKNRVWETLNLYIMNRDGSEKRVMTSELDREIENIAWKRDGKGLFFQFDDQGKTKLAFVSLKVKIQLLAENCGNTYLGRPYGFGKSFTVSNNNRFVYTQISGSWPADIAVGKLNSKSIKKITGLNNDILNYKKLGKIEEIWYKSSFDQREIQGWIVTPHDFNKNKKYPLILEIHGGPVQNYGPRVGFFPNTHVLA